MSDTQVSLLEALYRFLVVCIPCWIFLTTLMLNEIIEHQKRRPIVLLLLTNGDSLSPHQKLVESSVTRSPPTFNTTKYVTDN